jgi:hypothetical protein
MQAAEIKMRNNRWRYTLCVMPLPSPRMHLFRGTAAEKAESYSVD